jgi:NADPH2:quinone reductase
MKAWLLDEFSGIDKLHLADWPDPHPNAGEVVLEVEFAALNPADRYLAEAQYPAKPPLPHILGRDAVGRVLEIGPGVAGINPGDRLMVLRGEVGVSRAGTFAQRVVVPVESLVSVPQGWTPQQSAGATLVYMTAYQALSMWGDLARGIVLVTGASGGVGIASIQLAKAMGHTVVALSRGDSKRDALRSIGADGVLDASDASWTKTLKRELNGRRVDLAIDNIGGNLLPQVIETLADQGRVSCVGRLAGPVPEFNTASLFFRRLRLGGVAVGAYTPSEARQVWDKVVALLNKTNARPLIDTTFNFDQLPLAFARLQQGPLGKVLVQMTNDK